ncbi:MAG: T9SS type A sorting domain-containing protein [Bacteroidetes bacterium]|nr:T9SS type A sorting domain-containing protein [Bacteroidota bacterium]
MKKSLLIIVAALATNMAMSQTQIKHRTCGTHEYNEQLMQQDPQFKAAQEQIEINTQAIINEQANNGTLSKVTNVVNIPVVVHVVYKTAAQNISDVKINAQIAQLNLDFAALNTDSNLIPAPFKPLFANTQIQFCLAQRDPQGNPSTGIVRVLTTVSSFTQSNGVKYTAQGGSNAWPASSYLNLWVCNLGSSLLGYAQFPGGSAATDGVVCLYGTVGSMLSPGSTPSYNLGRTNGHEIGHWLNLRHIWGDANCGNDLVSDTPTQQGANFGCPNFPKISCNNGPNGEMFVNYMDYVDDDCMHMFTVGQSARMNALFNLNTGTRKSLLTSLGCTPVGINEVKDAAEIMNVYPNPSAGVFALNFNADKIYDFEINVYNELGAKVYSKSETKYYDNVYSLDLNSLKDGMYNMVLTIGDKSYSSRISIQK